MPIFPTSHPQGSTINTATPIFVSDTDIHYRTSVNIYIYKIFSFTKLLKVKKKKLVKISIPNLSLSLEFSVRVFIFRYVLFMVVNFMAMAMLIFYFLCCDYWIWKLILLRMWFGFISLTLLILQFVYFMYVCGYVALGM